MSVILRGAKNAFRNWIRTVSVVLILAISISLALVMYLAQQAVSARIENVKSSIGNSITVTPAGSFGFEGGGEPLTGTQLASLDGIGHIVSVNETLNERLETDTTTNLKSAIEPGTLGNRRNTGGNGPNITINGQNASGRTFSLPIVLNGISETSSLTSSSSVSITAGSVFASDAKEDVAVVGKTLAEKNSLEVDSTFTANGKSVKVVGIFDAGTEFANNTVYMPIASVQNIMEQIDQVTSATITVDSIENVDSVVTEIKSKLGSDKADVTSNQDASEQALEPLMNIQNISWYSLVGALAAGAVITLLTMIMIVRERRREIGVLKAIGASNISIVTQFVSESLVLTLLAAFVGIVAGVFLSNPILTALVSSSTDGGPGGPGGGPDGPGGRAFFMGFASGTNIGQALTSLQANVGPQIILYGILAAVVIAVLGSALPSFLISKIRPAEVIRGE